MEDKIGSALNLKQIEFCKIYTSKEEFFGNGVKSYASAYGYSLTNQGDYETCKVNACKLLTNPNIQDFIASLLEVNGLNDLFVDKQLLFLINQHSDLNLKLKAIQEYNRLKSRGKIFLDIKQNQKNEVNISNYQSYMEEVKNIGSLSEKGLLELLVKQIKINKQ